MLVSGAAVTLRDTRYLWPFLFTDLLQDLEVSRESDCKSLQKSPRSNKPVLHHQHYQFDNSSKHVLAATPPTQPVMAKCTQHRLVIYQACSSQSE